MNRNATSQIEVGLLLVSGILFVCGTILVLSELPDLFKPTYQIVVWLPDASGVVKGADVLLAGVRIGKVATAPRIIPGTASVKIALRIDGSIKLRQDALIVIQSSGFFGDKFVNVQPMNRGAAESAFPYLQDGSIVKGAQALGLASLISSSLPLFNRANHVAEQLDDMATRLNTEVLTKSTTEDWGETAAKMQHIAADSRQLGATTKDLIDQVKSGNGVLGQLLYDKQVRRDLTEFMANYKEHGLLFYSDDFVPAPTNLRTRPPWRARP